METNPRPNAAPMRVVAHNGARVWGGAERALVLLLAGLAERGHYVRFLCSDPGVAGHARELGVEPRILPLGGDVSVHHAVRLAGYLRRERPDVLLVGTFKKVWLAGLAARMAGVPRVVARIGLETDVPRNLKYRFAFRHLVDHVAVVSVRMRPAYERLLGWKSGRVSVIPTGVPVPERRRPRGAVRAELGIAHDVPCVGVVARLASQKRIDRLLEAVARLPEVHCVVAGEGPQRGALERRAAELGIGGRVRFPGFRRDVGDVLDALDVFVLTSDREGLSSAMLEAMAAGLPVVSTPVSGAEEALSAGPLDFGAGLVVDFDAGAVAEGIARLLADLPLRRGMGEEGAGRAGAAFSFERMVDRWEEVLFPRLHDEAEAPMAFERSTVA
jgi:glycosyltransferase involved in cell wall biosynthesis